MSRSRSMASLLILRIVLLAVGCMLVFGGSHAWWQYQQQRKEFKASVETLADTSLILLSNALWNIDMSIVRRQVQWLSKLPDVGYVRVRGEITGELIEGGFDLPAGQPALSMDIMPPQPSHIQIPLGQLEIWERSNHYQHVLRESTLPVLLGYALFTALICLMVAWVMRRELHQPLDQIARFAAGLKPNELSRPLILDRPRRRQQDEIDLVVQGFGQLQRDLRVHIEHLDLLVAQRTEQLEDLVDEVQRLSLTDALTGCYNRRALDQRLPAEIERCKRYGRFLSVIFVDVDRFKQVNDVHGHAAGDMVLKEVGLRCQEQLRSQVDWAVRYGGEEFLIVLPEARSAHARELAQRLGAHMRNQPIKIVDETLTVTVSLGVAQLMPMDSAQSLLARADAMLYEAKRSGRDCVCVAQSGDSQVGIIDDIGWS